MRFNSVSSILKIALSSTINNYKDNFLNISGSLKIIFLKENIKKLGDKYRLISKDVDRSNQKIILNKENKLALQTGLLDVLSHNNVLKRGFALIKDKNKKIIRKSQDTKKGDNLVIQFFNDDKVNVKVEEKD